MEYTAVTERLLSILKSLKEDICAVVLNGKVREIRRLEMKELKLQSSSIQNMITVLPNKAFCSEASRGTL